jgi:hypothetical protein
MNRADAATGTGVRRRRVRRGTELDIHPGSRVFTSFDATEPDLAASGTRLLPSMSQRSTRFLVPDQRDFVAVTVRR